MITSLLTLIPSQLDTYKKTEMNHDKKTSYGLAIYIKKIVSLRQKKKLKYFTMQKYNLPKKIL